MQQPYTEQELLLIDAIHATPHDEGPRLAYADWLERQGASDYAEFIRLQCQKHCIGISNRDPSSPQKSHSRDFPWEDETAQERLQRLLAILPGIYRSERFATLAELPFYEEFFRGLSLKEIEEGDYGLPSGVVRGDKFNLPPLARARLSLHIHRSKLADWLKHAVMFRVDELRIWLHVENSDDSDFDAPDESRFDVQEIKTLADWPLLDRLTILNFCAPISSEAMRLIAQLVEPRVFVETSY